MNRLSSIIFLVALLLPSWDAFAGKFDPPKHIAGILNCKILPHSGINLLIHSTKHVRCTFTPADGAPIEHYRGETGIGFGVDISLGTSKNIAYSVLTKGSELTAHQLAGKYSGAGGGITFGLTVGESSPIVNSDRSIALQPTQASSRGAGAGAGITYLYLEADRQQQE